MALAVVYTTMHGMLLHENRGGTETFYAPDPLGSLIQCRDTSGNVTYSAEYWPYGEVQTESGSNPSPWSFCGLLGYLSDSASRCYVRARHYLMNLGQWLTLDPLWSRLPSYRYSSSVPTYLADPSGLIPKNGLEDTGVRILTSLCPWPLQLFRLKRCVDCIKKKVDSDLHGGGDKYLHCLAGCLTRLRCGTHCSQDLGTFKEVFDLIFGGTVELDDVTATNDGHKCSKQYIDGEGMPEIALCKACCKRKGWWP